MGLFWFISTRTVYGRSVFAVGGNAEATRPSGIPVNRVRIIIFATTGFLAAISGVLLTSRLSSGYAGVGVGWEFDSISAVIIGGTSLFGGEGSILGTLLGVLFIGLLGNGMVLLGVNPYLQDVARGVIILLAVLLSALQRPKTASLSQPAKEAKISYIARIFARGVSGPISPQAMIPPVLVPRWRRTSATCVLTSCGVPKGMILCLSRSGAEAHAARRTAFSAGQGRSRSPAVDHSPSITGPG